MEGRRGRDACEQQSEAIRSHQEASGGIRRHQEPSEAPKSHQQPSAAISSNQKPSNAIRRNQKRRTGRDACEQAAAADVGQYGQPPCANGHRVQPPWRSMARVQLPRQSNGSYHGTIEWQTPDGGFAREEAIRGNQRPSEAIRSHQKQSPDGGFAREEAAPPVASALAARELGVDEL